MKKTSLLLLGFLLSASPAFAALSVSPNPYTGEAAPWTLAGDAANNSCIYDPAGDYYAQFGVGVPFGPSGSLTFNDLTGAAEPSDGTYTVVSTDDSCEATLAAAEGGAGYVDSAEWVVGEEEEVGGPLGSFGAASVASALTDNYSSLGGTMAVVIAAVVLGIVALLGLGFGIRYLRKYITGRKF